VAIWGNGDEGRAEWGGWEIAWHRDVAGESMRGGLSTWVPVLSGEVRAPERGDRILPLGGVGHRPVRRLLMEARVPRVERARYPVLVRSGQVVWLPGVCRAGVDVPEQGAAALRIDVRAR
jgi:tRNA(Ile)-lysidine synthetase-like protein